MTPTRQPSSKQFSALVEFMERHGDLSNPQPGPQGRLRNDQLWRELTSLLNSIGGRVKKSHYVWRKVWANWKTKTQKKCMAIQLYSLCTGGGPSNLQILTALEQRVVGILGMSAVIGQAGIQKQGFNRLSSLSEEVQIEASKLNLMFLINYILSK